MTVIKLCGVEYPLRFSLRVVKACEERYGTIEKMYESVQLQSSDSGTSMGFVEECLWLLSVMLDAGCRYARLNGDRCDDPPDEDALLDILDIPDMQQALFAAISGDNARTVEAAPGKNEESAAADG